VQKPIFFTASQKLPRTCKKIDTRKSAFTELYFVEHPHIAKGRHDAAVLEKYVRKQVRERPCVWVYFPWRNVAVCLPEESIYFRLRTARNRNLILPDEQLVYRASKVGILGLSVGSAVLQSLVSTGGPKMLRIADPDILEITNLNRIRGTVLDVGLPKVTIAARAAWEIDPFLKIESWDRGVEIASLPEFINNLDVLVDEMDDIAMKFAVRFACKKAGIPVLMATDNGDSVILDVERFDCDTKQPIFHGRIKRVPSNLKNMSRERFVSLANQIIDPSLFTERQEKSVQEVGKTLSGIAQLGTAASLAGVAVAYAVRSLALGSSLPSGRYVMGCDLALQPSERLDK
jgi:molybdopterin/thiamine biosynthesis adenylyltransferase